MPFKMSFNIHYLFFYKALLVNLRIRERQSFFEETIRRSVLHQSKEELYTYFKEEHYIFWPAMYVIVNVIRILVVSFE